MSTPSDENPTTPRSGTTKELVTPPPRPPLLSPRKNNGSPLSEENAGVAEGEAEGARYYEGVYPVPFPNLMEIEIPDLPQQQLPFPWPVEEVIINNDEIQNNYIIRFDLYDRYTIF